MGDLWDFFSRRLWSAAAQSRLKKKPRYWPHFQISGKNVPTVRVFDFPAGRFPRLLVITKGLDVLFRLYIGFSRRYYQTRELITTNYVGSGRMNAVKTTRFQFTRNNTRACARVNAHTHARARVWRRFRDSVAPAEEMWGICGTFFLGDIGRRPRRVD